MLSFNSRILLATLLATVSNAQTTTDVSLSFASASQSTDTDTQATPSDFEPAAETTINSWHEITFTSPAYTQTIEANTVTESAQTIDQGYGYPYRSYPGVGKPSLTETTIPATTITQTAATETFAATTQIFTQPPDSLATELLPDFIYDLLDLDPSITSLPTDVASRINVAYTSLYGSYTSAHPVPSINSVFNADIQSLFEGNDPKSISLYYAIVTRLNLFPAPSQTASLSSALASVLSPYPSLSSDISSWMTVMRTWAAPEYASELNMLTSQLSITNVANPTLVSDVSVAAVQATQKAGAASTAHGSVLMNAGLAAAGMALVGMM